jgi:hypothetical protein
VVPSIVTENAAANSQNAHCLGATGCRRAVDAVDRPSGLIDDADRIAPWAVG